jgi:hypothetical protein
MLLPKKLEYLDLRYFNKDIYSMAKKCVNVKEMHIAGNYYEEYTLIENLIIKLLQRLTKLEKVSVACYSKKTLKVLRTL